MSEKIGLFDAIKQALGGKVEKPKSKYDALADMLDYALTHYNAKLSVSFNLRVKNDVADECADFVHKALKEAGYDNPGAHITVSPIEE